MSFKHALISCNFQFYFQIKHEDMITQNQDEWIQRNVESEFESFYHARLPIIMIVKDDQNGPNITNLFYFEEAADINSVSTVMIAAWADKDNKAYGEYSDVLPKTLR